MAPADLVRDVQRSYQFLADLTPAEAQLATDPYGREVRLYEELVASVVASGVTEGYDG